RTGAVPGVGARTRLTDLVSIVRDHLLLAPKVALFLTVAVVSRLRANRVIARSDYSTWLRDESTRR
ncbi:MAG TPA: hypothetical protein VIV12_15905, partial [Streptosporangiaceae bacterium]